MKYTSLFALGVLAALALTGCGKTDPSKSNVFKGKEDDHAHGKGPNGGVVFDLGKDHAEFTVDHGKKECAILFLTGDNKDAKPLPVQAAELTLTTKETKTKEGKVVAPMTITMKPVDAKDGKAAKFVGTDPGLGNVADFAGTVAGEVNGKPASGPFKEE